MTRTAAVLSLFLVVSPAAAAIRGRVMGGGHPVANAAVRAYAVETLPETLARVAANRPRAALATAQSAADGTFALPVEGNGAVVVSVAAAGFAPWWSEEAIGDADVLIALAAKRPREVAVRSADGPLAGARVVAIFPVGIFETTADNRGKFALDHDGAALVFVAHPRAAFSTSFLQPHDDVVDVDKGAPLKGRVVDAAGKGVANAKVFIDTVPAAVSAADGTFMIERAPQRYQQLSADAGDLGGIVAAGSTVIRVAPRVAVSGVVRDAEKRPLRGVSLALLSLEAGAGYAVSDEKGAFAFRVAPGTYQFGSASTIYHAYEQSLDVRKAVVKDLVVTRTPMITGVVKKRDGTPVEGAQIALAIEVAGDVASAFDRVAQETGAPHATTGPDGRFRITPLPFGQAYSVVAYKRGLPPGQSALVKSGTPPREMPIVLDDAAEEVSGVVRDAAGQPVAGVAVVALPPDRVVFGTFDELPRTDAAGRFSLRLSKGVWHMTFAKDGYLKQDLTRVEVAPPVKPMAVTLARASSIAGRVVRASGAGVAGVTVMVDETNVATTSEDGSFTLDGVAAGERVLRYVTPGHKYGEQRVTAPATDVRIVLADGGSVRGRVVDPAGAPVTAYELSVSPLSEKDSFPRQIADGDGRFVVDDAPIGEDVIAVRAKGFVPASRHVVVEAGKSAGEIAIALSRGRSVRGKVVSLAGEPLADVKISTGPFEESLTNADGTFEINGLSPRPASLSFAKSGFATSAREVRAGDGDVSLDVQLRPGLKLTGHVLAPDGKPLPSAEVTASSSGREQDFMTATTNENGEFSFDSLSAARYSLSVGNEVAGMFDDSAADAPEGHVDDVDVEHVHDVTIRTKMPVYGAISGEVAGNDLAGRQITVNAQRDDRFAQARGDSAGKYRIAKAPVGSVRVQASVDVAGSTRWSRPAVVEVPPRGEVRADLRFADTFPITGRVLRSGQPVSGTTVIFEDDDSHEVKAATGEGGVYRTALAAGHYTVTVGGYSSQHDVAGAETIDIKLEVTRIAVTVIDAVTSAPLADATVNARDSTSSTHATITAITGANGQASFDIPRSVSDLIVARDGYGTVAVAVSADTPSLVVKLARGEGATVRVVDARDGHPLSGYAIARDAGGRVLASSSEFAADGTAHFPLPPGHYRFSASASEYGSHTVAADVPGPDVLIPLRPGGKLLLQSQADVRADARLIEPGGEEYVRCWCNGVADIRINGRSTLVDSIAPGSYTLEIVQAGKKPRTIPVTVIQGQTVTVSLDP